MATLRFSASEQHILVGYQGYAVVYDRSGARESETIKWLTKGQWVYLELIWDDRFLLASNTQGDHGPRLRVFPFPAKPLRAVSSTNLNNIGPLVDLEVHQNGALLLGIHIKTPPGEQPQTRANLWRFNEPDKSTTSLHEFPRDDVTSATMTMSPSSERAYILTTFTGSRSALWRWGSGKVTLMRHLGDVGGSHFGALSSDARFIFSFGRDDVIRVWDLDRDEPVVEERLPPRGRMVAAEDCD